MYPELTIRGGGPVEFDETLEAHLRAIKERDFETFAQTVNPQEVVLVAANGEFLTESGALLERHREWFSMPGWSLDTHLLHKRESGDIATCVLELKYREGKGEAEKPQRSILSLVFARSDGRWLMVQDQNTPISA